MQHFVGFAANFHNSVSQEAAMFHISRECCKTRLSKERGRFVLMMDEVESSLKISYFK